MIIRVDILNAPENAETRKRVLDLVRWALTWHPRTFGADELQRVGYSDSPRGPEGVPYVDDGDGDDDEDGLPFEVRVEEQQP